MSLLKLNYSFLYSTHTVPKFFDVFRFRMTIKESQPLAAILVELLVKCSNCIESFIFVTPANELHTFRVLRKGLIGVGDIGVFGFIQGKFFAPANIVNPVGI